MKEREKQKLVYSLGGLSNRNDITRTYQIEATLYPRKSKNEGMSQECHRWSRIETSERVQRLKTSG